MGYCSLFFSLSFFLFFFNTFLHGATATTLVSKTCEKIAEGNPHLPCSFCETTLQAVPRIRCANLQELGLISIELALSNASHTRHYIKNMLKKKHVNHYFKIRLSDCFELYSDTITDLREAIKSYNSKKYLDANIQVSAAMTDSETCEDGFKEKKGAVSPLTKRNYDMVLLSAMALSIMNMVK